MLDRRGFVLVSGGAGLAAVLPALLGGTSTTAEAVPSAPDPHGCILTPESMEGPYFIDRELLRSDIREDRSGQDLRVRLLVAAQGSCRPLPGALVEIWHCDAQGYYSGYVKNDPDTPAASDHHQPPSDPSRFLRGGQIADARGRVEFLTKFPGWYAERAIHIHTRVSIGGGEQYTGQLYFTEELTRAVLATAPYYRPPGSTPRLTNTEDEIFTSADGARTTLTTKRGPAGAIDATVTLYISTKK